MDSVVALVLTLCLALQLVSAEIYLEHIHTVFLPSSYEPELTFRLDDGVAEQFAVNVDYPYVYAIGECRDIVLFLKRNVIKMSKISVDVLTLDSYCLIMLTYESCLCRGLKNF